MYVNVVVVVVIKVCVRVGKGLYRILLITRLPNIHLNDEPLVFFHRSSTARDSSPSPLCRRQRVRHLPR